MRRPWNIIDSPVYSLATYADGKLNMNICTYVTAISMKPKQYAIAVYDNTKTLANLEVNSTCILQLLHLNQLGLVRKLGKQSGLNIDKQAWLDKHEHLDYWQDYAVLKDACAYLKLELIKRVDTGGDHQLFCFEATQYSTLCEQDVLMFQDLVEAKVIL